MARKMRVAIMGGGIGGLTAAAALTQRGFEVAVYERAQELREVGAGLQIAPNPMKVIRALGIEEQFMKRACEAAGHVSLKWDDGSLRYRRPFKGEMRETFGGAYCFAHRADLHSLLLGLVPESAIHVGAECTGAETTAQGGVAHLADGGQVEADVIIGADGIHSAVRKSLFGESQARFTQQICWRAMVPIDCLPRAVGPGGSVRLTPADYIGWLGPSGHVLNYPIRGGEILNIFAGRVSEEWADESWSVPSSKEAMIAAYAGWNEQLLELFSHVDSCFKWGIYDRDPLERWTQGRVTLLGDAAHPMMPTLAQGAAVTMEDGYALARNIGNHPDAPERALQAYEAERRPRTSAVQLQARQQFANNRKVPAPPPIDTDWIYGHDATVDPTPEPA